MDKATVTTQAASKDNGNAKVQAANAVTNLREVIKAETTSDLESRRPSAGVSASASAGSASASSSSSNGKLRGVYDGNKDELRSSRDRERDRSDESRRRSRTESCSESRSRTKSRSRDSMDNLTNSVRFKGKDLDSAFGPRVFGQPSVQRVGAPSLGSGRGNGGANGNALLRGTQIPSADIQIESNRALGFHLQPDV